ncbi:MAG: hypothetical protein JSV53_00885 [candidate division WOR-3 bacterium]|nr:MAG: hypothetical protein JSV53_00885 [candidate division WOR-3 bacterium]
MNTFMLIIIAAAGVKSLLMPASPVGVTTSFAMASREEAIFYNPSNFEAGDNYTVQCSYNRFYLGMQSVSLSLSKKFKEVHFGLGIVNFDYGEIEYRPDYPTEDPLINYRAYDFSLILGASVDVSSQGRIGINLKYVTENIYIYSDYALAMDIAFAYRSATSGITFGATNFGTKMMINNGEVNLPACLNVGGFQQVNKLTLSGDLRYLINDAAFEFGIGASMPVHQRLTLSAAANYRDEFYPGFGLSIAVGALEVKYGGSFYPKNLGMVNNIALKIGL